MSDVEPGWHADPAATAGSYRWWDGRAWTRWLSHDQGAPAPEPAVPGHAPADHAPAVADAADDSPPEPAAAPLPAEPLVRLPVAVAVVVGVSLVAVVAVGAVVSASAQGVPSGPAAAPPPRSATRAISYDPSTRAASVGRLRLTLAGSPYVCDTSAGAAPPSFETAVVCNAPVHPDYDGRHHDWTATSVVGVVPAALVTAGDLEATGRKVFGSVRGQFFSRETTKVTRLTAQPADLGPGGQAMVVSGEVHYDVPHVASRYDRLLVVVVALADGTHAVVVSSRPDDSGAGVQRTLQASLDSLTTR